MSLIVRGCDAHYGSTQVLRGIALSVQREELVTLIGANGAGKSTLLRCIAGLHRQHSAEVVIDDVAVHALPAHELANRGLSLVLEGRQLFTDLTVQENLIMGLHGQVSGKDAGERQRRLDDLFDLFPILREFAARPAGLLSGGQQQMLAIGRALVRRPSYLLLDEPSLGLAPMLTREILSTVRSLTAAGVGVLLAEQNAYAALHVADRGMIIENGRITRDAPSTELLGDEAVAEHYLGGATVDTAALRAPKRLPAALRQRELAHADG